MPHPTGLEPVSSADQGRTAGTGRTIALAAGIPLLLFTAVTVLAAAHDWAPRAAESSIHAWVLTHRPAWAVRVAGVVTDLGTGVPPYLAAVAAGILTLRRSPRTDRRLVALCAPVLVLAVGQLLRNGLMRGFARPRPPMADWVAASPSGYSYPSGHAFTSAAAAGLLGWALMRGVRRSVALPLTLALGVAAVAVGLTRIYLGVHWPLDVLGGWCLAAAWLGLTLPLLAVGVRPRPAAPPAQPVRDTDGGEAGGEAGGSEGGASAGSAGGAAGGSADEARGEGRGTAAGGADGTAEGGV
ncbi:phosphatase PAP2 family protein [Kitasatospora paranensis]|uniref:Phosphatase PAP2 family protein n=1 Tax=Kitasatospora paranensis TaxID=258053 RepID=A0ABW2G7B6_9ACTN